MGETKAKYHHLIPRTYLSAWEHGNGTLYIRFLENKERVVERNKDNIAGMLYSEQNSSLQPFMLD